MPYYTYNNQCKYNGSSYTPLFIGISTASINAGAIYGISI